jgi:hypothetical protein
MPHKFKIGRICLISLDLCAARNLRSDPKLPERDGEFEYHIKHLKELHERIARESELSGASLPNG